MKDNKLIIGEEYESYGKYIGITRVIKYNDYDYKEHRFSVQRGLNLPAHINSVKVDDTETIDKILNNNNS
jgi:hypothetical protein